MSRGSQQQMARFRGCRPVTARMAESAVGLDARETNLTLRKAYRQVVVQLVQDAERGPAILTRQ